MIEISFTFVEMKLLTHSERVYYSSVIDRLLYVLSDNAPHYTFELRQSTSTTSHDAPLLRRILRTLEDDGKIENVNLGYNIHKWKTK